MTTFHLVRHAHYGLVDGSIGGRMPGQSLSARGRAQAEALAARFRNAGLAAVLTSPRERAVETATAIAAATGLAPAVRDALDEMDFAGWTGHRFDDLARDPAWQRFNRFRSGTGIPGGERMAAVQVRMTGLMEAVRDAMPAATVVLVGHGDPIRAALLYWLGAPLDHFLRLDIAPASVSTVELGADGVVVRAVNDRRADE